MGLSSHKLPHALIPAIICAKVWAFAPRRLPLCEHLPDTSGHSGSVDLVDSGRTHQAEGLSEGKGCC